MDDGFIYNKDMGSIAKRPGRRGILQSRPHDLKPRVTIRSLPQYTGIQYPPHDLKWIARVLWCLISRKPHDQDPRAKITTTESVCQNLISAVASQIYGRGATTQAQYDHDALIRVVDFAIDGNGVIFYLRSRTQRRTGIPTMTLAAE
jgi:hypothetical protein